MVGSESSIVSPSQRNRGNSWGPSLNCARLAGSHSSSSFLQPGKMISRRIGKTHVSFHSMEGGHKNLAHSLWSQPRSPVLLSPGLKLRQSLIDFLIALAWDLRVSPRAVSRRDPIFVLSPPSLAISFLTIDEKVSRVWKLLTYAVSVWWGVNRQNSIAK